MRRVGVWMVVATYAVAFVLAVGARVLAGRARRQPTSISRSAEAEQRHVERIWLAVAVTLGLLLINRQFDVLDHLVQSLRRHAHADGWYERRKEYQAVVIAGLVLVGLALVGAVAVALRHSARRLAVVVAATVALVVFVCVRAVSLHDVDHLLGLGGSDVVNGIVEMGLLAVIITATVLWVRDQQAATTRVPTALGVSAASVRTTVPRR